MCRGGLDEYLKLGYDYIGAPWQRLVRSSVRVGNGGFSLRRRSRMMRCIQNYENSNNKNGKLTSEDIYFSKCLRDTGGKLPPVDIARDFAMETMYSETPMAVHRPYWVSVVTDYRELHPGLTLGETVLKRKLQRELVKHCPVATLSSVKALK